MSSTRERPTRFRILIVGRANAGKTTILKKLCDDDEGAMFLDANHIPINLTPTLERGIHDVNDEIIHPSRPAFIFHDSRGLEAGSVEEMNILRTFIAARSSSADIDEQLHVVWYCISADDERPLRNAEQQFFEMDTGQVPIIAVFTKCDALESKAYSKLRNVDRLSEDDAEAAMAGEADEIFQQHFLSRLREVQKRPVDHVRLHDLNLPEGSIATLVDQTATAMGNRQATQKVLILACPYNLLLRTKYGIFKVLSKVVDPARAMTKNIVRDCLTWLAHVWCPEKLHAGAASNSREREDSMRPVVGHADLLLEEAIPTEFVSAFTSNLADSTLSETNYHSVLRLVAGVFTVADRVYRTREGAHIAQAGTEPLLSALRDALTAYRSVDEEGVRTAIANRFSPSYPTSKDEVKEVGMDLAELVQERCRGLATLPGQASS